MKKDAKAALLPALSLPLQQLGRHLRAARQGRGWTVAEAAARAVISPATYKRMEAGDPSVSMGAWAAVLFQLRLLDAVIAATAPAMDEVGEALRARKAVKRVRSAVGKDRARYDF